MTLLEPTILDRLMIALIDADGDETWRGTAQELIAMNDGCRGDPLRQNDPTELHTAIGSLLNKLPGTEAHVSDGQSVITLRVVESMLMSGLHHHVHSVHDSVLVETPMQSAVSDTALRGFMRVFDASDGVSLHTLPAYAYPPRRRASDQPAVTVDMLRDIAQVLIAATAEDMPPVADLNDLGKRLATIADRLGK